MDGNTIISQIRMLHNANKVLVSFCSTLIYLHLVQFRDQG